MRPRWPGGPGAAPRGSPRVSTGSTGPGAATAVGGATDTGRGGDRRGRRWAGRRPTAVVVVSVETGRSGGPASPSGRPGGGGRRCPDGSAVVVVGRPDEITGDDRRRGRCGRDRSGRRVGPSAGRRSPAARRQWPTGSRGWRRAVRRPRRRQRPRCRRAWPWNGHRAAEPSPMSHWVHCFMACSQLFIAEPLRAWCAPPGGGAAPAAAPGGTRWQPPVRPGRTVDLRHVHTTRQTPVPRGRAGSRAPGARVATHRGRRPRSRQRSSAPDARPVVRSAAGACGIGVHGGGRRWPSG